ncbi:uncharacterized protein LOC142997005 isoform X2 [Genypterus blacodes]|uniref:uncharacterized protein LOC142997005 isoform X2 n=1 Tax=Genypterus blacodes TaxID=154954 RepID=UPI003F766579
MQLHVHLLLFIITTDKILALVQHQCGGNVHLDQKLAGQISLALPDLHTVTSSHGPVSHQTDRSPLAAVCTWMIDVSHGQVFLSLAHLESGSSISVRCRRDQDEQMLRAGGTGLLLDCGRDKAALTWTGRGHSSNTVQLSYYVVVPVQEAERNSSVHPSSPVTDLSTAVPRSQTGIGITSKDLIGPKQTPKLVQTSSPLLGLTLAGTTDKETLLFPQEEPNNGADTSAAAHITDGPMNARESTHPDFQTQRLLTTDAYSHPGHTLLRDALSLTQTAHTLIDSAAGSSNTIVSRGTHKYKATPTIIDTDTHTSSSISSSPPKLSSLRTWETGTGLIPHGGPVDEGRGGKQLNTWRSQRSTDGHRPNLTSTVAVDPLRSSSKPQEHDSSSTQADFEPTPTSSQSSPSPSSSPSLSSSSSSLSSSSSSQDSSSTRQSFTTHNTELNTAVGAVGAAGTLSGQTESFVSVSSHTESHTATFHSSDEKENITKLHTHNPDLISSATNPQTSWPQSTLSLTHSPPAVSTSTQRNNEETQTQTPDAEKATHVNSYTTSSSNAVSFSTGTTKDHDWTSNSGGSATISGIPHTLGDGVQYTAATETLRENNSVGKDMHQTRTDTKTHTPQPTYTHFNRNSNAPFTERSSSLAHILQSTASSVDTSTHSSMPEQTRSTLPTSAPLLLTSSTTKAIAHTLLSDQKTAAAAPGTTTFKSSSIHTTPAYHLMQPPSSTTQKQFHGYTATTQTALPALTTANTGSGQRGAKEQAESGNEDLIISATPPQSSKQPPSLTGPYPSQMSNLEYTPSTLPSVTIQNSTATQIRKFYIVSDQPAAIKVELIELLLQIVVEESRSAVSAGLEEDTTAWVEPYILRAPGFRRVLGVLTSGRAVQILLEFRTSAALQWLGAAGPISLLELTGLAQALREGRTFRSSKIINITLGGLQGGVCDWLLQCPAGYDCVSQPGTANHSCSSVCHTDYCHHHGICTHHPGQLPVCRCLVGEDFWYMGLRCDVRMTRARLVGACLAILLVVATVIAVTALVAVRRYKAILIQAKVDQTRSSYRRFNHFDELSGRFWLRSWAGSADSLDNPAFTRSDELLHLRALDRPCCYHDDTLSLASTCPSHGTHINTIYPHSSQYGWRGSEMSMADGVLDSGKASDLSVCSWPVEPIQWTPFPLLQQLALHRAPPVRASRPRSYCEGMELVDMGKSWTA